MLSISFEPPLRAETRVRPAIQGDAAIKITFHASLEPSEWHRLEHQGAFVELWSDIPADGRSSGEWEAIPFAKSSQGGETVHLEASLATLSLRRTNSSTRYSYTYRVKHSSGDIQWLGSSNANGHITLESEAFWSPSENPTSPAIGTLHWAARWRGWLLSPERAPTVLTLLSLTARESSPAAQTLLLLPGSTRNEACNPPTLVLHSQNGPLNVSHGKVYCETPRDVTVEPILEGTAVAEALKAHGILSIPTSSSSVFFVLSSSRARGQFSTSFHPIWLSPRLPRTSKVLTSEIRSVIGKSGTTILYSPGQGFSQPILTSEDQYEFSLSDGSEPLRTVRLQGIPKSEGQLVGIATPSTLVQIHSSPSIPSPTLTAVDATNGATTGGSPDGKADASKNIATVTVSKSSNVLFARTVAVPDTIALQMERLLRVKLLYTFYRLALYIISLVIPFLGINLSLKISPAREAERPGVHPRAETEAEEEKLPSMSSSSTEMWKVPLEDGTLYYDVEPVGSEVHVAFLGDAADDVSFTVDGNKIDPWSIVQTWHGDDLHQFLLKMEAPSRLGITIQPTPE